MQHLINSCEFTGIIALLTIFHKYIQYGADWCQFISFSSSWSHLQVIETYAPKYEGLANMNYNLFVVQKCSAVH